MKTTVKLQEMFSYSLLPIWIIVGLLVVIALIAIISLIVKRLKNRKKKVVEVPKKPVVIAKTVADIATAKKDYLAELAVLEREYTEELCTVRDAYQRMSAIIRGFVEDVTGIKVQNYTLQDIKVLEMPALEELIEEYYSPEFARESEGDVLTSITKTRGAIERWN